MSLFCFFLFSFLFNDIFLCAFFACAVSANLRVKIAQWISPFYYILFHCEGPLGWMKRFQARRTQKKTSIRLFLRAFFICAVSANLRVKICAMDISVLLYFISFISYHWINWLFLLPLINPAGDKKDRRGRLSHASNLRYTAETIQRHHVKMLGKGAGRAADV